jgi:hypothetical protein
MKTKQIVSVILFLLFGINTNAQIYLAMARPIGNNKFGYINEHGNFVIPPRYNYCYSFNEYGLAPIYDNLTDQLYFIDTKGDTILSSTEQYQLISNPYLRGSVPTFMDGMLKVKSNGKYGFINLEGELIIPAKYDSVTDFNQGLAAVRIDTSFYIIDALGNEERITERNIKSIDRFSEGFAAYCLSTNKWGFLDKNGSVKIPPRYLSVGFFKRGVTYVEVTNGTFGYVDTTGTWVIWPDLAEGKNFSDDCDYVAVYRRGTYTVEFISSSGQRNTIKEISVSDYFSEDLIKGQKNILKNNNEYGFLNPKGEWQIPPQFEDVGLFHNGYCIAFKKNRILGFIDKTGLWAIEPSFTALGNFVRINDIYCKK